MNTYLMNFIVYTFAMIGFVVIVLFIYKKSTNIPQQGNTKNALSIETSMKLAPTKTLYIIKAGDEKFLIAADAANTTMLSRLSNNITAIDSSDIKTKINEDIAVNMVKN